jgi:hypothetical protein
MDDFGNQLHWTTEVKGWHSMGLYGYAPGYNMEVLYQWIDFAELIV